MANYVLIHGASHGGWCWEKVKSQLEKNGHFVITPDLPGHEQKSNLTASEITFDKYVQCVLDIVNSIDGKVILVGHSLGGAVIEKAIDEIQEIKIEEAFFVCGFVPQNGDIVAELLKADTGSKLVDCFITNKDGTAVELILEKTADIIYNGCNNEDIQIAKSRFVSQSVNPIRTPIIINKQKNIKRTGIICKLDKSITPETQEKMYRNGKCKLKYLNSGHAPFFSHSVELSQILMGK